MNCTNEEAQKLVSKYFEREWSKIKQIDLPDTREFMPTEAHLVNEFKNLCSKTLKDGARSDIIHVFFKSLTSANKVGYKSPREGWKYLQENPEAFKKFLMNRYQRSDWYNEKKGANRKYLEEGFVPLFIYAIGLTTSGQFPMVSTFKPSTAKNILLKYAPEAKTVLDTFAGYGGRLLGTIAAGKQYIGYDLNDITIAENNNLLNWLKTNFPETSLNCSILQGNALDGSINAPKADVFFSCPPYEQNGKQIEEWMSSDGKITCQMSQDDIITTCLRLYDCKKYIFVLNAQNTSYTDYIKEDLVNKNYINARNGKLTVASKNYESIIVITAEEKNKILQCR